MGLPWTSHKSFVHQDVAEPPALISVRENIINHTVITDIATGILSVIIITTSDKNPHPTFPAVAMEIRCRSLLKSSAFRDESP